MDSYLLEEFQVSENIVKKSPITDYFHGKCVLSTGGTGLLGRSFIEKVIQVRKLTISSKGS